MEVTKAVIREENGEFCIFSEKTSKKLGCYSTKEAAEKRLKQIEMFKHTKENKAAAQVSGEINFVDASEKIASTTNFIEASAVDINEIILRNVIGKLDE